MKAMILDSGTGSRLFPLTKSIPKCLIDINGKTILGMQLAALQIISINDIIITTGLFKEKIEDFVKQYFSSMNITCIFNERYDSTNYIYSMYKCNKYIDDDFLLMHGDLVFDINLLTGIVEKKTNAVLMNRSIPPPEKDFKGLLSGDMVKKIGTNVSDKNAYFLAPLYKLSRESFQKWMNKIIEFIDSGNYSCYAEDAFNTISDTINLQACFYEGLFCKELDTFNDLEMIKGAVSLNT